MEFSTQIIISIIKYCNKSYNAYFSYFGVHKIFKKKIDKEVCHMNKRFFSIFVSVLMLTVCSCSKNDKTDIATKDNSQETNNVISSTGVKTYAIPSENITFSDFYGSSRCPSQKGGYYYSSGKYLIYRQLNGDPVTLCIQSGCEHSDESCAAYMGGSIECMGEYHEKLYAIVSDDTTTKIVCHDPSTGEHETLLSSEKNRTKENGDYESIMYGFQTIAYGKLYYATIISTLALDSDDAVQTMTSYEYNLDTGENREMPESFRCVGPAGGLVFEVINESDSEDGKERYQLSLYNMETFEKKVIVDSEHDGLTEYVDYQYLYGSAQVYRCNNTLYTFDVVTGKITEVVAPEDRITNFWFLDNKVFYITHNEQEEAYFWYVDMSDLIPVQIKNKGNTEVMEWSLGTEGTDYFNSTQNQILSKEDFYNENY